MCTAIAYSGKSRFFGRNLDLDFQYNETVTIMPRCYPLSFLNGVELHEHYSMIGIAYVKNNYPLYYDAVNEKGVAIAGLRFSDNAVYHSWCKGKENLATYELIPWLLSQCSDLKEVTECLESAELISEAFDEELPPAELHWMISDKKGTIVVEPLKSGLRIYQNPTEVLTNNPPFDMQLTLLENNRNLSPYESETQAYSLGLGAMGLPGDYSSHSRFSKACFVKKYSVCDGEEELGQLFHVLKSVEQPKGCVRLKNGGLEKTIYSSCCDMNDMAYYYTTYENSQICAVDLKKENLNGTKIVSYPLLREQQIKQIQKK